MSEPKVVTVGGYAVTLGKVISILVLVACLVLFLTGHLTLAVAVLVGLLALAFLIG